MIVWILLGLVLLFILVLIVRTLRFKPLPQPPVAEAPVSLDLDKIVQDMADMIRCAHNIAIMISPPFPNNNRHSNDLIAQIITDTRSRTSP